MTTIRCSSLSSYADCPRRSAARIFRREIEDAGYTLRRLPLSIGALVGTAVHSGAAHVLAEKAVTGTLPPRDRAIEYSRETLAEATAGADVQFDAPGGPTHNHREAIEQTVRMTGVYADTIAPQIEPLIVEERFEAEVEPGLILSGQPDLICREPNRVRDLKTGARMPASFVPQLGGYSLLARSHGYEIDHATIDYLQRVKVTKPQPPLVSVLSVIAHAETAAANIIRAIANDIDTFRHGDAERRIPPGDPWAFMANPASVLCSAKWCPAHSTDFCHEGRK